ncbi:hypothetical protein MLD38_033693 [Melastoma candidum]|uniref:Uncharacterized protein n=1 Tax=Melastoma candidum TaxID=119954 RepID=A0ACB9M7K1_9MYRT|nr:hypothetical protein MLD38_033693 [Melastoma candidum]
MALSVVSYGGVTLSIELRCRSFGNRKLRRGRLEFGRGGDWPRAAAAKASYDGEGGHVEVIGVGGRKDAVLDFCLESPYKSPALRLWTAVTKESTKLQLQRRLLEKDFVTDVVDPPSLLQSSPQAIIIVATAGYGLDQTYVVDFLRGARSPCTLIVAIILKPFPFEGQRRQNEVKFLVENIREYVDFCIDIDTNLLLKDAIVTLDEALKTANNAVLLAINAVAVLTSSEKKRKLFNLKQNKMNEVDVTDVIDQLRKYKEGKIGFGAGFDVKTSVLQALSECPFLGLGGKDFNSTAVCILTIFSADQIDVNVFLEAFREYSKYGGEVIVSSLHDSSMEAGLLLTTIITVGYLRENPKEEGILSRLVQSIPSLFNLWGKHNPQKSPMSDGSSPGPVGPMDAVEQRGMTEGCGSYSVKINKAGAPHSRVPEANFNREFNGAHFSSYEEGAVEFLENSERFGLHVQSPEGNPAFQREQLKSWNYGPGYEDAQVWARERRSESSAPLIASLSMFQLPVGVKHSGEPRDIKHNADSRQNGMGENDDLVKAELLTDKSHSSADLGLGALQSFYNAASTPLEDKCLDISKKQGNVSARAASMLDAERNNPRTWNPVIEMEYRGCIYKGRCHGGLPEGKGRLVLRDGSIYDGMWHNGKRSGSGTYYFSNGDVFQGSWRDDVMHGKGWFYFHTGDRWFANFWKGKANGEGRFYTKSGDVCTGDFKDGWRQGDFLCVGVDGQRFLETWDQGRLVSRQQITPTLDGKPE